MDIRNIAIIAHVDHGTTTLVNALLKLTHTKIGNERPMERVMDNNDLERERGITIFSKNASIHYGDTKINIIDTPGHADFGGEVERVLKMADGALLLVDAKEGPMPQTKFVLKKAINLGLRVIVVINKIDKKDARCEYVLNTTFDLFGALGASDRQLDFPVIYAAAIAGKAGYEDNLEAMTDITPILDTVIKEVPPPTGDAEAPLQMLVVSLRMDNYKGKLAIGRIFNGRVKKGDTIMHINRDGKMTKQKVTALMAFEGLETTEIEHAQAGDIILLAGIPDVSIGDTVADATNPIALDMLDIEQPTVKMTFRVNDSPFNGKQAGTKNTSRLLRERLDKELETDVALRVEQGDSADNFIVSGRGELHLAILIEKMRREGFELQVTRPQVVTHMENGVEMEPAEDVYVEVPETYAGTVIEKLGKRRGEMKNYAVQEGHAQVHFLIPTRGLIGYRNEFMTDTKGTGILNSLFNGFIPWVQNLSTSNHSSLIAYESGVTTGYALESAGERGQLFVGPATEVYAGQVVGQNAKDEDLEVNVCKEKRLSNMRSSGADMAVKLEPHRTLTLEEAIEYISDDEWVEIVPSEIRIRKQWLSPNDRKKNGR